MTRSTDPPTPDQVDDGTGWRAPCQIDRLRIARSGDI